MSGVVRALGAVFFSVLAGVTSAHAVAVSGQGTWESTLQGRDLDGDLSNGFEAYYDTALDLTWLADANLVKTSGADSDGRLDWMGANAWWGANLNVHGITGWRLPTVTDNFDRGCSSLSFGGGDGITCGYNVDTKLSEMAHLFYVTLGNRAYYAPGAKNALGPFQDEWGLKNTGPFENIQTTYWSSSCQYFGVGCYWFDFSSGMQYFSTYRFGSFHSWAVRSGDVSAVPEVSMHLLALSGIFAALLMRGKRR